MVSPFTGKCLTLHNHELYATGSICEDSTVFRSRRHRHHRSTDFAMRLHAHDGIHFWSPEEACRNIQ